MTQTQLAPGSRFSVPPFTDEVEQPENNDSITGTFSAANQVQVQGIIPFMQSDVIYAWLLFVSITETVTGTTSMFPTRKRALRHLAVAGRVLCLFMVMLFPTRKREGSK